MLTARPSDTVKELLRQGKADEAISLYRQQGATDQDVIYLNMADGIATERNISLDEALSRVVNGQLRQGAVGCGTIFLFVICWLLAGVVLFLDLVLFMLTQAFNSPCPAGSTFHCGNSWTTDEIKSLAVLTSIGIGLILCPILVRIATR